MKVWFYFSPLLADNYNLRFSKMPTANLTNSHKSLRLALSSVLVALLLVCVSLVSFGQDKAAETLTIHQCWRYETADLDPARAVSDGSNLYFGERGGRVTAISATDGKLLWASEIGGEIVSNFLMLGHELRFVTRSAGGLYELRSLGSVSGIANRSTSLLPGGQVRLHALGNRIVVVSESGLTVVDGDTGKLVWTKKLEPSLKVVISQGNALIAGLGDGQIIFMDSFDGRIIHKLAVKFMPTALLLNNDHLLVGDERGNVMNLDVDKNAPLWTFRSGGKISGIYALGDSDLLITSFDNFAYLVDRQTGHVAWKRRQSSRIVDAAIVNAKYAGVTPFGEPTVVFLDPESGKPLGQLVMPGSIEFIQPAQLVGESVVTFTNEGIVSSGFLGCKRNEKAEAKTSAFK